MNSYIFVGGNALSLNINNRQYSVNNTHQNWDAIVAKVRAKDFEGIPELINIATAVKKVLDAVVGAYRNIEVNVDAGIIKYAGKVLNNVAVDYVVKLHKEGFDVEPMLKFIDNLLDNPSERAVTELWGFLEYGKMPITEDGHFLAYKRVRSDYKSVHDGKTDNSIGAVVEMPRNMVNENSEQTCSSGLHFCSHEYLKSFSGERVVICKINPKDVVSIPTDYNNTKGRACKYTIIGELNAEEVAVASDNKPVLQRKVYNTSKMSYEDSYRVGYGNGRKGISVTGTLALQYDKQGYEDGHKDGRLHRPKKHK
jgi:hypothetical protein